MSTVANSNLNSNEAVINLGTVEPGLSYSTASIELDQAAVTTLTAISPEVIALLNKLKADWGMDPQQTIDVNDPLSRIILVIVLTYIQQNRNAYSYDQFIKGCAKSIGVDPDVYDFQVNPVTMGFENNVNQGSGYVKPNTPTVANGGSSVPRYSSGYSDFTSSLNFGSASGASVPGLNMGVSISTGGSASAYINASVGGISAGAIASYTGVVPVTSDIIGYRVAAITATLESGGLQNQSDVFQSMLNRSASGYYGGDLFKNVTAREQYSPMSAALYGTTSGGASTYSRLGVTESELKQLASRPDWNTAIVTRFGAGNATNAAKLVEDHGSNGPLSQNSREFVGSRTEFLGSGQPGTSLSDASRRDGALGTLQGRDSSANTFGYKGNANLVRVQGQVSVTNAASGPVNNPSSLGLPNGSSYTSGGATTDDTGTYTTYTDTAGKAYYRYNDGSVYDSNDNLVRPPDGVPSNFTQETYNPVTGEYTYQSPNSDVVYNVDESGSIFSNSSSLNYYSDQYEMNSGQEASSVYSSYQPTTSNTQRFDDGSSITKFDDGSTLVTDSSGKNSSTPAPGSVTQTFDDGSTLTTGPDGKITSTPSPEEQAATTESDKEKQPSAPTKPGGAAPQTAAAAKQMAKGC